jgi:hypothetical protein
MILNLFDEHGKRKPKWISTGLPVKGNKKRAEEMLMETRKNYAKQPVLQPEATMLFADFLENVWLPSIKQSIEETTLASYLYSLSIIVPYFREKKNHVSGIKIKGHRHFLQQSAKQSKRDNGCKISCQYPQCLEIRCPYGVNPDKPRRQCRPP